MNRFLTFIIALLIAVTSQQMAMARTMMKNAAGQVVICTGQGVKTVTIDHNGEPLDIVHICPDCALTCAALQDEPTVAQACVIHMQTLGQTPVCDPQITFFPRLLQPRGPPRVL